MTELIVIEVRGGVVQEVHLPPHATTLTIDWDTIDDIDLDDLELQIGQLDEAIEALGDGHPNSLPLEEIVYQLRCERTEHYIKLGMTLDGDEEDA